MQYGVFVFNPMWHRKECETSKTNQKYSNMLSSITVSYVISTHGNIALDLDQVFEAIKCHNEQITYHG